MSSTERPAVADRVNVALIAEAVEALAKLQERTGLKKVDLVNRALLIYEFVDSELRAGNPKLRLEDLRALEADYGDEHFVTVLPEGVFPTTGEVTGRCHGCHGRTGWVVRDGLGDMNT